MTFFVLVLALIVAFGVGLRARKLWRDQRRDALVTAPPTREPVRSPGFRILDGSTSTSLIQPQPVPRIDTTKNYVFNENAPVDSSIDTGGTSRDSNAWALRRSDQRSRVSMSSVRLSAAIAVVLVVLVVAGTVIQATLGSSTRHTPTSHHKSSTTTTTSSTVVSTTTTPPGQ